MRVNWVSSTTSILFITERLDNDWVIQRAYTFLIDQQNPSGLIPSVAFISLPKPHTQQSKPDIPPSRLTQAYLFGKHPKASYQKCQLPASFPRSQDARDQWLGRDR